jgi:hypothetical protein
MIAQTHDYYDPTEHATALGQRPLRKLQLIANPEAGVANPPQSVRRAASPLALQITLSCAVLTCASIKMGHFKSGVAGSARHKGETTSGIDCVRAVYGARTQARQSKSATNEERRPKGIQIE